MLVRILIVDDEPPARDRLRRMLAEIDTAEIVGEAEDGAQAVEMIEDLSPDLVLLDIQMPGLDGLEVIEALKDPPLVIFVTAYDEYAIRAFEINALDYLLKPFSRERLKKTICRAREELEEERKLEASPAEGFARRLAPLMETLASQGRYLTRLAVRAGERIRVLEVAEIEWIGAERERVFVHAGDESYRVRRTLAQLESRLDPSRFFRAHRATIVNLSRVREIIPWFKGSHKLRLTTGAEVELSRAQARALRRILGW